MNHDYPLYFYRNHHGIMIPRPNGVAAREGIIMIKCSYTPIDKPKAYVK
ncbi:MAG: hypothetical protein ACLRWH_02360 [Emergencia sp.]